MNYWLLKTEPDTFSIDDLEQLPHQITPWEGVRNYQVRNMMRDDIKDGDLAFFYHSSCKVPGIVGTVKVVRAAYPDITAFDSKSPYFDAKSTPDTPRWLRVDVKLVKKFKKIITLAELRALISLKAMVVLKKGSRLSITPVTEKEWHIICDLGVV